MKSVMDSESSAAEWLPPPYVDERLVEPETREEMVRGRRIQALPANPEHGDRHTEVTRVIGTSMASGYTVSTDLLTRAGPRSDFATDTCVRRSGIDPRTGSRYLEELAFEVVNEQSMRHMIERAEELTSCGVRRLIAIFVKKGEIREWSPKANRWLLLDPDDALEDPTLVRPVPLRALLDEALANNALVDALDAKNIPRLQDLKRESHRDGRAEGLRDGRVEGRREGRAEGLRDGLAEGLAESILRVLHGRGLPLADKLRARLEQCDDEVQLRRWLDAALTATSAEEVFE